ncbi:MAG: bacillithiol biosynthesis cysteine-adding enzyme BshC [Chitinophagales bacterium]|nr:bacillithiol biosynthesis cysteine-adding enzyme BshC [Chitinophagales bacterium]
MIGTDHKFDVKRLPILDIGGFNPLINDYINRDPKLRDLYNFECSLDAIDEVIQQKSCEIIDRNILSEEIRNQYSAIDLNPAVNSNIDKLKEPTTFTIVTAHQPCIFSGPLYFIYKILSAIKVAELCNDRYQQYHFVPVFWIGGEDHDFEEINHIHLFNKTLRWDSGQHGAVGRMKLQNISALRDQISEMLSSFPHAKEVNAIIEKAYRDDLTLSEATRVFVDELFSDHGLIVIDQDSKSLKEHFIPVIKKEVLQMSSQQDIQTAVDYLSSEYKVQAHPREINMFYLNEGERRRIVKDGDMYSILDTDVSFSEAEISDHIDAFPERFSPNVILRPLYQQKVLPAVSYVGGPGEIAYWLQLKQIFLNNNVCFPMLILRDNALLIDNRSKQQFIELGFEIDQMFSETDSLIKAYVDRNSETVHFQKERDEIKSIFEKVKNRSVSIDKSLEKSVESEYRKIEKSLENLENKVVRAQKREHETAVNKIERLKSKFFPSNSWQERYDNILIYLAMYGEDLLTVLKESFNAFNNEMKVILEKDQEG